MSTTHEILVEYVCPRVLTVLREEDAASTASCSSGNSVYYDAVEFLDCKYLKSSCAHVRADWFLTGSVRWRCLPVRISGFCVSTRELLTRTGNATHVVSSVEKRQFGVRIWNQRQEW